MALPPRRERSLGLRCRHDQVERRATPLDASRGAASSQINGVDGKKIMLDLCISTFSQISQSNQHGFDGAAMADARSLEKMGWWGTGVATYVLDIARIARVNWGQRRCNATPPTSTTLRPAAAGCIAPQSWLVFAVGAGRSRAELIELIV
jgi:hypothetical protein